MDEHKTYVHVKPKSKEQSKKTNDLIKTNVGYVETNGVVKKGIVHLWRKSPIQP